jgi:CRP/FNR family transcriptional regulator, cyclic AMP receptor protein
MVKINPIPYSYKNRGDIMIEFVKKKNGMRSGNLITIKLMLNYDEISQMAGVQKNTLMQVIRDLEEKSILTISPSDFKLDLANLR